MKVQMNLRQTQMEHLPQKLPKNNLIKQNIFLVESVYSNRTCLAQQKLKSHKELKRGKWDGQIRYYYKICIYYEVILAQLLSIKNEVIVLKVINLLIDCTRSRYPITYFWSLQVLAYMKNKVKLNTVPGSSWK